MLRVRGSQSFSSRSNVGHSRRKLLRTTIRAPSRGRRVNGGSCARERHRSAAFCSAGVLWPYSRKSRSSCLSRSLLSFSDSCVAPSRSIASNATSRIFGTSSVRPLSR